MIHVTWAIRTLGGRSGDVLSFDLTGAQPSRLLALRQEQARTLALQSKPCRDNFKLSHYPSYESETGRGLAGQAREQSGRRIGDQRTNPQAFGALNPSRIIDRPDDWR